MPDTHNPAVQGSAARLIKLLQKNYPPIESFRVPPSYGMEEKLTAVGYSQSLAQCQASLLHYLDQVIKEQPLTDDNRLAETEPTIEYTIKFIKYVNTLPSHLVDEDDKKRILEQIEVIARIHQGGVWDDQHQHWSINQFYNKGLIPYSAGLSA